MIHFTFSDTDQRYVFLKYDNALDYSILKNQVMDHFNPVDPICYLPAYQGPPFRQEFVWEYVQPNGNSVFYCAIGLTLSLWKFFKTQGIEFDGLDKERFKRKLQHSFDEFKELTKDWNEKFQLRPYQVEAAYKILEWKQSVSSLATRAGKTSISYLIFRYAFKYLGCKRILMIVPSIDLVKQGYNDFQEYGGFFDTECLWSGGKCVESSNLTIATFQTLINFLDKKSKRYNPDFFKGYDLVFVDETHRANAKSIKTIISQPFMKDVKLSFGMTGTLPKENTIDDFCLHSLLGAKIQEIRPKELMDAGYISPIKIYQHRISYSDKMKQLDTWIRCAEYSLSTFDEVPNKNNPKKRDKIMLDNPEFLIAYHKTFPFGLQQAKNMIFSDNDKTELERKLEYKKLLTNALKDSAGANGLHVEVMMVHFFEERIDYLIEILKKCPRNTLILAQHVEYIKHIGDRLKEAFPDRPVVTIYGASKERKTMKDTFKNNDNIIAVGGYSIMSTGLTLSNLCYGVLFESYKSNVINMQSMGRGLANAEGKEYYELHDITDVFDNKYASRKILLQGIARTKIYSENDYEYHIIENEL